MKNLINKWITEYDKLCNELIELDDKYNNNIKNMPEKDYRHHKILQAEILMLEQHITDIKLLMSDILNNIDQDLF